MDKARIIIDRIARTRQGGLILMYMTSNLKLVPAEET